ncbi:fibropellin-3-like [Mytilus galloprovincialis]|uniref:fibropellin-3-like n=1 Tax=Mytilus galloprovincialis TaxID=29158 RepID=UPI003F7B4DE5
MLLKISEIFISLLIINTNEGVLQSITGSSFTKNKYSDSHVILAFNNVGPLMCVSDCMLYKKCNAVNFNRQKLECELLAVSYPGDNIIDRNGSSYTEIGGWKMDRDICTPNPCKVGQKCTRARDNHPICLKFDAPCDVNPCVNGVCRNKVNDYRCICPDGYFGDHCERDPCYGVSSCNNGHCVVQGSSYYCHCHSCWGNHNYLSLCTYWIC